MSQGAQSTVEIIIQNNDESRSWLCTNNPWGWHQKDSMMNGSCRTGICFCTVDHTVLSLVIHESPPRPYKCVVQATLSPGTNFIPWCSETTLAHESDYIARFPKNCGSQLACKIWTWPWHAQAEFMWHIPHQNLSWMHSWISPAIPMQQK